MSPRPRRRRPGIGSFVLIVGPDGTGKSTLAQNLIHELEGNFSRILHVHWRPGLLPRPGSLVGAEAGDPSEPHAVEPHGLLLSLALLAYHWLDFFLGTWLRIVPVRASGGLVVMERGWLDIAVDPRRYHLTAPEGLVEMLGRFLPGPDLVFVLQADPQILAARKAELPQGELSRQMKRWGQISFPGKALRLFLDASKGQEQLVDQVTRELLMR